MTDPTDPVLPDDDPPVPPSLAPRNPVSQQEHRLARHQLRLPEPGHDPRLVDDAVGAAHAAAEVRLQLGHLQGVGDEGQGRFGGEAGAVFREEVEGGTELHGLGVGGREVEGEEGVVN